MQKQIELAARTAHRRQILATLCGAAAGSLLAPPAFAQADSLQVVAGTIYNPGGAGWRLVNSGTHVPLNIKSISQDHQGITINYSKKFKYLHTFIAVPDETIATSGYSIQMGASVDISHAVIYLGKPSLFHRHTYAGRIDPATVTEGNIWLYGLFS